MQDVGNFGDALFKDTEGGGIGEHQGGDVFGDEFAKMVSVELAARIRLDVLHFVSGDDDRCGIRAVR